MKKIGYILLMAVACTLACKKQEEEKPQPVVPKIEIPTESQAVFSQGISLEAGESAQSQTVKFTTTVAWTADVADVKSSTWLSVSPTSGSAGSVTLTVTAQPNNEKLDREASVTIKCGTASQKFTVRQAGIPNVDVTSVTLDQKVLELVEGDEATLTATVKPDDATDKTVTWSTDKADIATVDETGKVTAIKEGLASIIAKAGEMTDTCTVTVAKKVIPVESVTLDKKALELVEGDEATLTATVKPDDATDKTVTWSTDKADIASVDETGKVTAIKEGSAAIIAKAGDKADTCVVAVSKKFIPVTSVTLDNTSLDLVKGQEATLVATVKPDDATDKIVTWSTSDASVATVENGKIKAVGGGKATITAKAGDQSATCTINVTVPVSFVTLSSTTLALVEGDESTLSATVAPEDATDKTVTWSSSNEAIATVTGGKVVAVAPGTATITAKAGDKSATCKVTVAKKVIPVESVTLDKTTLEMVEGDETTLSATVKPDDATDKTVTWSTSNAAVATVADGKVVAVATGTTTITAKAGEKSATCAVTVVKKIIAVTSVTLDKTSLDLTKGQEVTLSATVKPDDATNKTVTWSTSNANVVTVENGKVKAVGGGEATITAKAGDQSATCAVTVTVPVASITLDKTSLDLTKGQEVTLAATVKPDDATVKTVTWSTSDAKVATVENGKVKAVGSGKATITAKVADLSATCAVSVTVPVASVKLDKTTLDMTEQDEVQLTATVSPDDATDKTVTWSSSKESVATVDATGKVTAVKEGNATITAKAGDKTAICNIAVAKLIVPATGITLNKATLEILEGDYIYLDATLTPANSTDPVKWSSSNAAAATVSSYGKVTGVAPGTAIITAQAGEKSATCSVTVKEVIHVESVELDTYETSIERGQTQTLTATVAPDNASRKTVSWTSDNSNIASVNSSGVVTARAGGETNIRAKADGKEAVCKVKVTVAATRVSLNKQEITLDAGKSETLTASVGPNDATDKSVRWNSSNPNIATVSDEGKVTGVTEGNITITATTHNGLEAKCTVHVVIPDDEVTLDQTSITLEKNASQTLVPTVLPTETTDKKVSWHSNNTSVATVDANGKVTGVAGGTATITVTTARGHTAQCTVTVVVTVQSVSLNKTTYSMAIGNSFVLQVLFNPEDATDRTVTWDIQGSTYATIQADGIRCTVMAIAEGTATVTVTSANGKSATCTFTILPEDPNNTEGYGGGEGQWDN